MQTADFNYDLPPELIAQTPPAERTQSRMLVVHRATGRLENRGILDLRDYLTPGDLLVLNDTRVIPARLFGRRRDTSGKVEVLLIEELAPGRWMALYRASGRARPGLVMELAQGHIVAEVLAVPMSGRVELVLQADGPLTDVLERFGVPPLPPYIHRPEAHRAESTLSPGLDRDRYQTVYAHHPGAVAAPTAGLHFSTDLLAAIRQHGVEIASITLHVGLGTFLPVKSERVEDHRMEPERFTVGVETAEAIRRTRARGGRVIAVGSTTVRTLETVARAQGEVAPGVGRSDLFIHGAYAFRAVDMLLTNFHLPQSTLLMMACAFAGWGLRDRGPGAVADGHALMLHAYRAAIASRYRFYSYGDCMLIV